MRNIAFLAFFFMVFFITSCDSVLTENPKDRLTQGNFYQNEDQAIAAVDATYNQLYSIYNRLIYLVGSLPVDVEKNGLGMPNQHLQNLEFMRYTPQNSFVGSIWSNNYSGISRANAAINNISGMKDGSIDKKIRERLVAEARFLRGLYYFNLVRFFGGVPLVTQVESIQDATKPRAEKSQVYEQIISDLEFAEQNLPISYSESNQGRATKGAAKVLLGKVYLRRENWTSAVSKLAEVVENESKYGYGLHEDYGDNWRQPAERGKEAIFYVEFMHPPHNSNSSAGLQGPKYSIHEGQGIPCVSNDFEADIPTEEVFTRFSSDDERKSVTFQTEFKCGDAVYTSEIPIFTKYREEGQSVATRSNNNHHVLRHADALLMYGEALFEQGNEAKALRQINRVRERAFNDDSYNYSSLTRQKIWNERLFEFAQEGKRWFDLTRQGRLIERMKEHSRQEQEIAGEPIREDLRNNIEDAMKLMPIPQREMDANPKLEQNPGW
jgi:tetratricopeptide (TPR) repeat protein